MKGRPKKPPRQKDLTGRYHSGELEDDSIDSVQRFTARSKNQQQNKTAKTTQMRADEQAERTGGEELPSGTVVQIYSLYCEVESAGRKLKCVTRKTLSNVSSGDIAVGDVVRFRDLNPQTDSGEPDAVIEQLLPRKTLLTRADSFKQQQSHPIVANAEQMLIIASVHEPNVKWGLVDRMLIAAGAGGLRPILVLNKIDLATDGDKQWALAHEAMEHYSSIGIQTLQTSVIQNKSIDDVREILKEKVTVLAGHSGVGKSSLIRAIVPELDLRVGDISAYTGKGRHTTTSARIYTLPFGGQVIDTPGVKLFGLWNVSEENLMEQFPDVEAGTAPAWRQESYDRILLSLRG
jgi:ribosome biogenesis GTPase